MIEWMLLANILFVIWFLCYKFFDGEGWLGLTVVAVLLWSMWHWRDTPEETAAKEAKKAAEQRARETPHVGREADGCKVYAFERGGRDHYFTRCPATTDTETNWTESCGKSCTRHKASNIVTENK